MKRILTYLLLASATMGANADYWVRDTEPGILEVHYTLTPVFEKLYGKYVSVKDYA